jgi:hypothetical protein
MIAFLCVCRRFFLFGRWHLAAILLIVGLSGCSGWNLRGEGFRDNDLSKSAQRARSEKGETKKDIDYWSFSEKGHQIERDFAQ